MGRGFILVVNLAFFIHAALCLRMEKVQTPSNTFVNSIARLECHYDLEGEALYMVKWYKDNVEFYRYVPQDKPEAMVFHLHGIHVKLSESTSSAVVLENVGLTASGRYTCEVSTDSPSFRTASDHSDMIVVARNSSYHPYVTGDRPTYQFDDQVDIYCTYFRPESGTDLKWWINGEEAPSAYVIHSCQENNMTTLGLKFPVSDASFNKGKMTLRCSANSSGNIDTVELSYGWQLSALGIR